MAILILWLALAGLAIPRRRPARGGEIQFSPKRGFRKVRTAEQVVRAFFIHRRQQAAVDARRAARKGAILARRAAQAAERAEEARWSRIITLVAGDAAQAAPATTTKTRLVTGWVPVPSTGKAQSRGRVRAASWARPKARPRCGGIGSCQDSGKGSQARPALDESQREAWAASCIAVQRRRKAAQREAYKKPPKAAKSVAELRREKAETALAGAKFVIRTASPLAAIRELTAVAEAAVAAVRVRSGRRPGEFAVQFGGATFNVVGLRANGVRP